MIQSGTGRRKNADHITDGIERQIAHDAPVKNADQYRRRSDFKWSHAARREAPPAVPSARRGNFFRESTRTLVYEKLFLADHALIAGGKNRNPFHKKHGGNQLVQIRRGVRPQVHRTQQVHRTAARNSDVARQRMRCMREMAECGWFAVFAELLLLNIASP